MTEVYGLAVILVIGGEAKNFVTKLGFNFCSINSVTPIIVFSLLAFLYR